MKHNSLLKSTLSLLWMVFGFGLGVAVSHFWLGPKAIAEDRPEASAHPPAQTVWTCSMHPQIRETQPGICRICLMDLIPLDDDEDEAAGERVISFSPGVVKLMQVQTSPVERRAVSKEVRLVGKLTLDEARTRTITAWVGGRIDRLYADFTGMRVNAGDHLVEVYSPELITAQAEYLEARAAQQRLSEGASELLRQSAVSRLAASREKLLLLGLTESQLTQIVQEGRPRDHLTIYAPFGGVIIERLAAEGMYVQTGTPIYKIADLSTLWVMLDAYESDLMWLRFGQTVAFTTEAWPGEVFTGRISFISPLLNDPTRTVRVRAVVDNPDGRLKPNMLVRAVVESPLAEAGRVIEPALADKWICPMHGEIVKDGAGACDICEMPLVTAQSLGYAAAAEPEEHPLVIPVSAALLTGRKLDRAVVYAVIEGAERPTYVGKEIVLGPRAGDYYIVRDGLMEGERVVTRGNFKIDSELQLRGRPSLMSAPDAAALPAAPGEQVYCPVMDTPINKEYFVEYEGKKVYFCCPGCDSMFLEDPEKYLHKLPQFAEDKTEEPTHNHVH